MAIESQGCLVRRQSTAAGTTATVTAATIGFSSAHEITRSDAGSFVTDGFVAGMRVENNSTFNSTLVFTLSSVAATSMGIYDTLTTQTTGASITLTGHTMAAIGEVAGFNGPNGAANVIDVTHLASTAKEKLIGIRDEGQVSLDIIYDTNATAFHTAMRIDRQARTRRIYDITMTDNGTLFSQPSAHYFDAYITNFSITGAVDDVVKGSITLEITSAVRFISAI